MKRKRRHLLSIWAGYVQWRGETNSRERKSNFSLDLPAFGPSVSGEARSKVAPHDKGYAWAPVFVEFRQLRGGSGFPPT